MLHLLCVGAAVLAGGQFFRFFTSPRDREARARRDRGLLAGAHEDAAPEPGGLLAPGSSESETRGFAETDRSTKLLGGALAMVGAGALIHPAFRLASIPFLLGGLYPLARTAWRELWQHRKFRYATLMVVQTAFEISVGFVGLSTLGWLLFMVGQRIHLSTQRAVRTQLTSAFDTMSDMVWLVCDDVEVQTRLDRVTVGDRIAIRAGEQIPVDGRIIEGAVGVDERALTGETRLQERLVGDEVRAATHVSSGYAIVRVERTGRDTISAQIEGLLASTVSYEQELQDRVTQVTDRSVVPTLYVAGFGLLSRGAIGAVGGLWTNSLDIAWLSSPLSMMSTIQAAARAGLLVKDGRSLEELARVDTVIFDKTGTLTLDRFRVHAVQVSAPDLTGADLLRLAAALEGHQPHPIARAIVEAAQLDPRPPLHTDDRAHEIGFGVRGHVEGRRVLLGSRRMMAAEGVRLPPGSELGAARADQRGHSLIHLAIDGVHAGMIELAMEIRPEGSELIAWLQRRGLDVMMLTGDEDGPTRALADQLGISRYFARVLPEEKAALVARLQAEGRTICFVGDGINDALALRQANVSISMHGASALAIESAQFVVQHGSLAQVAALFEIGDRFSAEQRVIFQSALATTGINVAGFLVAGFSLTTVVAVYLAGFGISLATAARPWLRGHRGGPRALATSRDGAGESPVLAQRSRDSASASDDPQEQVGDLPVGQAVGVAIALGTDLTSGVGPAGHDVR